MLFCENLNYLEAVFGLDYPPARFIAAKSKPFINKSCAVVYNQNNEFCIALFFRFVWLFTFAHYFLISVTRRRILVAGSVKKLSFTDTN